MSLQAVPFGHVFVLCRVPLSTIAMLRCPGVEFNQIRNLSELSPELGVMCVLPLAYCVGIMYASLTNNF